jgi:hypothetical protein
MTTVQHRNRRRNIIMAAAHHCSDGGLNPDNIADVFELSRSEVSAILRDLRMQYETEIEPPGEPRSADDYSVWLLLQLMQIGGRISRD